jgi:DNA-binding NtrC family response regulator
VRELKSLIRRLVSASKMPFIDKEECVERILQDEQLETKQIVSTESGTSFTPIPDASFDANVAAFEKYLLAATLAKYSSHEARDLLKLSRTRFYEKMRTYLLKN